MFLVMVCRVGVDGGLSTDVYNDLYSLSYGVSILSFFYADRFLEKVMCMINIYQWQYLLL